jgi:replicative DNA helicase
VTALDDGPEILAPGATDDVILAEKAVLASMIASRPAAEELIDLLGPEDCFAGGAHRAVYVAVRWLTEEGALAEHGALSAARDGDAGVQRRFAAVLSRLVATEHGIWRTGSAGVTLGSLLRHATPAWRSDAATVLAAARQRRTVAALETALTAASRPGFDADEGGDLIRKLIDGALGGTDEARGLVTAADLFTETLERLESAEPPGVIQFPWEDLRSIVPYLRPGQLVTVAARPSLGKSVIAQDLARYTSLRRQVPAVLFTMEMDRAEVMDRLIAAETGISLSRISERSLGDDAWDRIAAAQERFTASKLVIDDAPRVTLAHIRATLRGMARTEPAQLAIVDYLQLMAPPQGSENRQQEVTALVGGLKAIAREFRIPLVMLCQLNRGPEQRQDKRPHLSDARESGSVDNDSDIAILIHREDFYDPESPKAGQAELIVEKHRNGRRGTATLGFHGQYARFVDLTWSSSAKGED